MTHTTTGSAAMPITADGRRCLRRLRALAERLDQQAALVRNGGYDTTAERRAGRLTDDALAVRWALRQIAPESEFMEQFFSALGKAGGAA